MAAADLLESCEIVPEDFAFENTILQAGEIGRQLTAGLGGQPIHPPGAANLHFHHLMAAQVGELLGCPYGADAEDFLNVAHALRLKPQQVENAQAIDVAQALVDRDDLFGIGMRDGHDGRHLSHALNKRK